jgi:hypothetical protein
MTPLRGLSMSAIRKNEIASTMGSTSKIDQENPGGKRGAIAQGRLGAQDPNPRGWLERIVQQPLGV